MLPFLASFSKIWSSFKKGKKAALRYYELGLGIIPGDICWVNGPFPAGVHNDYTIFKECGLLSHLDENERVEADNGYKAGDPEFCKTPSGVFHAEEQKTMRRRVMDRQEVLNARLKSFAILKQMVFRHDLEMHGDVFHAVLVLLQINIEHGEPLYDCLEYIE